MDDELTKRIGYIAGRLAEEFPDCRVTTRQLYRAEATVFEAFHDGVSRQIVDYTVSHSEIRAIVDVELIVRKIVDVPRSWDIRRGPLRLGRVAAGVGEEGRDTSFENEDRSVHSSWYRREVIGMTDDEQF